jgi:hypothetical protein
LRATPTPRAGRSAEFERFRLRLTLLARLELHDLFHLRRVVEHAAGGAEAFLPPDADELGVGVGHAAAHPIQVGPFREAQAELVVFVERGGFAGRPLRPDLQACQPPAGVVQGRHASFVRRAEVGAGL